MTKTPTPIGDEINYWEGVIDGLSYMRFTEEQKQTLRLVVDRLKSKLPAERAFAEKCFDAGYARANDYHENYCNDAPDFSTFYKNEYGTD